MSDAIYLCPTLGFCEWEGQADQLWSHLERNHNDLLLRRGEFFIDTRNLSNDENNFFKHSDGQLMLLQIEYTEDEKVQIRVRHLRKSVRTKYSFALAVACEDLCLTNENDSYTVRNVNGAVEIDLRTLRTIWKCRGYLKCTLKVRSAELIKREDSFLLKQICPNDTYFGESSKQDIVATEANDEDDDDEQQFLRCVICSSYMTSGPIFTCSSSHNMCHWCRNNDAFCCSEQTFARNPALEAARNNYRFPCRFNGCSIKAQRGVLLEHEAQCQFCLYVCPQCQHKGAFASLEKHFRIAHPSVKQIRSILNNSFPPPSALLIIHKYGIYLCTCTALQEALEWKVVDCSTSVPGVHFECYVQINKRSYQHIVPKTFQLQAGGKVHRLAVNLQNIKPYKAKNAMLVIAISDDCNNNSL